MDYHVIRSYRRTISLRITPEGSLEVRCPMTMGASQVEAFVKSKETWIQKHLHPPIPQADKLTAQQIRQLAQAAGVSIPTRVAYFATQLGVTYGRITIRSQKTRWGSCSTRGNLNFNCLLMLTPTEVLDYVVVHELCHRKEMNHSKAFWQAVEAVCPNYRQYRKWLKDYGHTLIARLPG